MKKSKIVLMVLLAVFLFTACDPDLNSPSGPGGEMPSIPGSGGLPDISSLEPNEHQRA